MRGPIAMAANEKSYPKLAGKLIREYPQSFCKSIGVNGSSVPMKIESLATKLGALDKGNEKLWWRRRPELTKCLVKHIGIEYEDLHLDEPSNPYEFEFVDAPDLPILDLRRRDHWVIAKTWFSPKPGTISTLGYSNQPAMGYWLSEPNATPNPKTMEWLHVQDDLEFELLSRRLRATEAVNMIVCQTLVEIDSNDDHASLLFNPRPLAIAVQGSTPAPELYRLISQRQDAPMLVISRFSLPELKGDRDDENSAEYKKLEADCRGKINCWDWDFLDDWRTLLVSWFGQRLTGPETEVGFDEKVAQKWLLEHDPNCKWISRPRDVLQFCQLFRSLYEKQLNKAKPEKLGDSLLGELNMPNNSEHIFLTRLIKARWKNWNIGFEGDLPQAIWVELSNSIDDHEMVKTNNFITPNPEISGSLHFKSPMVVRLTIRDLLTEQIKNKPIQEWAIACFDSDRRSLIDAALDAISIKVLSNLANSIEQTQDPMVVTGVSEALFAAIGRRIVRTIHESELPNDFIDESVLNLLVNRVFKQLDFNCELPSPWSRPINSQSERIQWISVCWAWSLLPFCKDIDRPDHWLFPGWSKKLPNSLPQWLAPRPFRQMDDTLIGLDISGFSQSRDLIAIAEKWLITNIEVIKREPSIDFPVFFNIVQLRLASKGILEAKPEWWEGIVGVPWIEETILRNLKSKYTDGMKSLSLNWWPSLVGYFYKSFKAHEGAYDNLWGRRKSKSSLVFQWVMAQLEQDQYEAFKLIDKDDKDDNALYFLAMNPQILNKSFKVGILKLFSLQLPLSNWLSPIGAADFLRDFGSEAVEGFIRFIKDEQLGEKAISLLWQWSPEMAEKILCEETSLDSNVKRSLVQKCLTRSLSVAIGALQNDKDIFSPTQLKSWAQSHLPNAGNNAKKLFDLIEERELKFENVIPSA